jgi:cytochrome c oxidase assembly factor CtaG
VFYRRCQHEGVPLAHADAVPISDLARAWEAPAAVIGLAALSLALFAHAFFRLRARGATEHAPWSRALVFAAAVGVAVLALVSPLDAAGDHYLLSAHMLQHVLIGDVAPALALVALRGPLVFFLVPAAVLRPLARMEWLRRALGLLVRPRVALGVWAAVIGGWHVPAAYDSVLTRPVLHDVEHATFVLAGVVVWAQLVDPARRRALTTGGRIAFALVVFAAGLALADVLIFAWGPLYGAYALQHEQLFGLSPVTDQRLAGTVMMVEQLATLGTCIAVLVVAQHRATVQRERALETASSRP